LKFLYKTISRFSFQLQPETPPFPKIMALCTTALVRIVVLLVVMTGKACGAALINPDMQRVTVRAGGPSMLYQH
jgi:hypothetical protein